jgi:hypothetical protein
MTPAMQMVRRDAGELRQVAAGRQLAQGQEVGGCYQGKRLHGYRGRGDWKEKIEG